MIIAGLEKFTLLDYPGKLSAQIYTYGCMLQCPFCHNPELVTCSVKDISRVEKEEIIEFMKTRVGKLEALAITGGEPTLHRDLVPFMEQIKSLGFEIKLDTYGLNPKRVQAIMDTGFVDYWAMDVKGDLDLYKKVGYLRDSMEEILESVEIIKSQAPNYEFRTTVLKGNSWHSSKVIEFIANTVRGAKNYYIQNFRAGKSIDPNLDSSYSFSTKELFNLSKIFKEKVANVGIRN